jgi:uncharacterized membrane protein HdeD (DUF308 family)
MKKTKTLYWIFTVLFSVSMLVTAIPNVLLNADTVKFMKDHLGYPNYFTVFIGVAKILGSVAILLPIPSRLKEWAYAGLAFDLAGAMYSVYSVDGLQPQSMILLVWVLLFALSYTFYNKLEKEKVNS